MQISKTKPIKKQPKRRVSLNCQLVQKIQVIRRNIIGLNTTYKSSLKLELESVYADNTATNRPYGSIERIIEQSKKFIANPHTEFSYFGNYSTKLMQYSQQSLLQTFNANSDLYVALPTGSGSTGAIQKTINVIKAIQLPQGKKPDVFITPYEHHSNILPWIQFFGNVKTLAYDDTRYGLMIEQIQDQIFNSPNQFIIISVSAASNVTSYITPLQELNQVIRTIRNVQNFKKIIFVVDCAAYCSHRELDLSKLTEIDFVLLSPHKNLGGSESCGVLIAKKQFFLTEKPTFPGGGTVAYVSGVQKDSVVYEKNIFNRQIAGTPPFLGFYRAALSFELLKNQIGYSFIHQREVQNTRCFIEQITEHNRNLRIKNINAEIQLYGCVDFVRRGNVVTFNINHNGNLIHHNLVSTILADVFGIQVRSGCFCAGPFGVKLLKLTKETIQKTQKLINLGILRQKPGYIRLDLAFYMEKYEVKYLAEAIAAITQHGDKINKVWKMNTKGQIQRVYEHEPELLFGMDHIEEAQNDLNTTIKKEEEKYNIRKQTLHNQMEFGKWFLMQPQKYVEKFRRCE